MIVAAINNPQSTPFPLSMKRWTGRIISIVLVIGVVLGWKAYHNPLVEVPFPKHYPQAAEKLLADFYGIGQSKETLSMENYEQLFTYFLEGYYFYKSKSGALVNYPGLPSKHMREIDQLEGFTRMAPLIGAWLYSGRNPILTLHNGNSIDLAVALKQAIIAGTDPESEEYWGRMKKKDQRIVEAADVALVLWMTRTQLWDTLGPDQQKHISRWLAQVNGKKIPDNIWHLFVALVNAVLIDLGQEEGSENQIQQHYVSMKKFYRGKGWFTDGLKHGERFDHYNAWGIHYSLYWLNKIQPELDSPFIQDAVGEFSESYKLLFTPNGFPIYGRSICYRMALPAPLIMASTHSPKQVSSGEARRAMDLTWRYFIQHGAVRAGTVTQGFCGTDPRILDHYSGQGSCLWSLRSLIIALSLPATDSYWQTSPEWLPIEKQSYTVTLDVPGWVVSGDSQQQVTLQRIHDDPKRTEPKLEEYGWLESFKEKFTYRLARPQNTGAKYDGSSYSSELPFCECVLSGN
jgi:hypothetical protein